MIRAWISRAGHYAVEENPDTVAQHIFQFIDVQYQADILLAQRYYKTATDENL